MFGIDVEATGKIVAAAVGGIVLAVLTWFGNRLNRRDAASAPTPPAAMGFVLDGDTTQQLVRELKEMHADMVKWRGEDRERAKDDHIADLEDRLSILQRGQGVTHANQGEIVGSLTELRELLSDPEVAERARQIRQAPKSKNARLGSVDE